MDKLASKGNAVQFGVNLLSNKGGVYQAVRDYHLALGGRKCSLLDPKEARHGMIDGIDYSFMGADPVSRLLGRVKTSSKDQLLTMLTDASHLFLHGSYRLTAAYALAAGINSPALKPLFYIPHGSLDPWVFEKRGLVKRLWLRHYGRQLFENSRAVLAMTRNELKKIQKLAGVRENQQVIYLPLDLKECQVTLTASETRTKYGIPEDVRLLCYLGRLHGMKRPLETIDAVLASSSELHLAVVGPDDTISAAQLKQYVDRQGLWGRVHVTGPLYGADKYNLLGASDAYISLSHRENFNYTAAEAMGMGLPVILSPGNDLQGEVSHIECGWMLASLEPNYVNAALKDFLSMSAEECFARGSRGKQWVEANLSFETFAQKLHGLL